MAFKFRKKDRQKPEPKTQWPELVGEDAEEATKIIDKERPGLKIQIIPQDSFVSFQFTENRVRIFVDRKQRVAKMPELG